MDLSVLALLLYISNYQFEYEIHNKNTFNLGFIWMGNILLRSEFQINFCGLEDFVLTSLSAQKVGLAKKEKKKKIIWTHLKCEVSLNKV